MNDSAQNIINKKLSIYQKEIEKCLELHKKNGTYTTDIDAVIAYLLAKIAIIEWEMDD